MEFANDLFRLRPFEESDARAVQLCFDDAVFVRFLHPDYFPHPYTIAHAEQFVAQQLARDPATGIDRAVIVDHDLVGAVHLFRPDGEGHPADTWEIALLLSTGASGRQVASELVPLVLAHAFDALGALRVIATAHPHNIASRRVMEKSGMQLVEMQEAARTDREGNRVAQVLYALARP